MHQAPTLLQRILCRSRLAACLIRGREVIQMSTIGGFLPPWFSNKLNEQKKAAKAPIPSIFDCDEDSIAAAFARAKEEYIDKVMRGLNAYTDADIAEKLAEFAKFFGPGENATPEEIAEFMLKLSGFALKLQELVASQGNREMLITSSANNDNEGTYGYLQSKMQSNPQLRQQLQGEVL